MTVNFPHVKTFCSANCYEYVRKETIRLLSESNAAFAFARIRLRSEDVDNILLTLCGPSGPLSAFSRCKGDRVRASDVERLVKVCKYMGEFYAASLVDGKGVPSEFVTAVCLHDQYLAEKSVEKKELIEKKKKLLNLLKH